MYIRNIESCISNISRAIMESGNSYFTQRKKNQRIEIDSARNICFLSAGTVSFYHIDDGVLSITLKAPAILGLANLNALNESIYFMRCNENCDMWLISESDFSLLMDRSMLWKDCFNIVLYHLFLYVKKEAMSIKKTVRSIVYEHIKDIWKMKEQDRLKTSVFTFILSRNHISRSSVHKVIVELSRDGIIITKRGKLLFFKEDADPVKKLIINHSINDEFSDQA